MRDDDKPIMAKCILCGSAFQRRFLPVHFALVALTVLIFFATGLSASPGYWYQHPRIDCARMAITPSTKPIANPTVSPCQ